MNIFEKGKTMKKKSIYLIPFQNKHHTPEYQSASSSQTAPMTDSTPSTPSSSGRPSAIECYICGKLFGSKSIKIHEKQCLKKWNVENESLPADMQTPPPMKGGKS